MVRQHNAAYRHLQCLWSTRLAADLIDDDNLVLRQLGDSSEHAQQHALCQKGDLCAAAGCGIKSYSVCNVISVLLEGLKRDPAPNLYKIQIYVYIYINIYIYI